MIYIKADTEAQTVYFQKNTDTATEGAFQLELTGTDNLQSFAFEAQITGSGQRYVETSVSLPEGILPGEYVYTVRQDGTETGRGLAWVGGLSSDVSEFDAEICYTYEE